MWMKTQFDYILSSIVFISRIPIPIPFEYRSDEKNVKFFPLVGILLGIVLLIVAYLSLKVFGEGVTAVLTVVCLIVLTGGIHMDGLSDSVDGLLSYRDRDRIIEIMKDSRIGTMGVLAIITVVLLKVALVEKFIQESFILILAFFPIYGRLNIVNACFFGYPLKESKLGCVFIGKMRLGEFLFIQILYQLCIFGISFLTIKDSLLLAQVILSSIFTGIFLIGSAYILIKKIASRLDGVSGDILGLMCEVGEAFSLPVFYLGIQLCRYF